MIVKKKYKRSGYMIPIYKKNRKGIEMSFSWLFAMVAGGFILFLAIYAAVRVIEVGEVFSNTVTAKQMVSIFDPQETGLAAGKSRSLNTKLETKFYFDCNELTDPPFGRESISVTDKLFKEKYTEIGDLVSFNNKYIFVENEIDGKNFYMFSMGFLMPFKVSDLIMLYSKNYCFYKAPEEVKRDIERLTSLKNVQFPNATEVCEGIKVCFDSSNDCDIKVSTAGRYVQKDGEKVYYEGNLLYAAIFSSPNIYECNVKRLMVKFSKLAEVYTDKIKIIERKNCRSNVQTKLFMMIGKAGNMSSSKDLRGISAISDEINSINNDADTGCKLYKNDE